MMTLVVNLVRIFPSAKFMCFDAIPGVIIMSHRNIMSRPKYRQIY